MVGGVRIAVWMYVYMYVLSLGSLGGESSGEGGWRVIWRPEGYVVRPGRDVCASV